MNYIYDATDVSKRNYAISYKNLLAGISTFVGSLIGAGLALLSFTNFSTLAFIFAVSFVLRTLVAIFGTRNLKEVKKVKKFSPHMVIQEMGSFNHEGHQIHHLEHSGTSITHYD